MSRRHLVPERLLLLRVIVLILVGCAGVGTIYHPLKPGQSSSCLRIYSEAAFRMHQVIPHWWPKHAEIYDKVDTRDMRAGTVFAVRSGGRRFIVTAAHNLGQCMADGQYLAGKWPGKTTCTGGSLRVRLTSLAFAPERFYAGADSDVAIMEMPADFWNKIDVAEFTLEPATPAVGDAVEVWGFPSTSVPQLAVGPRVVMSSPEMLVLNQPLDPGFSGGPVTTASRKELLGMVARSTERQSRILPVAAIAAAVADFDKKSVAYNEPMEIH